MSPLDDIPQPWRDAVEKAGGMYSIRDLAAKAGAGPTTVSDLVHGRKHTSERTMQAVADALRVKVTTIREWASTARGEIGPFMLPAEANRLTRREREAVLSVVRAMLDPGDEQETGGRVIDLARPELPDFTQVAARRGESEGRRLVEEQDRDAERKQGDTDNL